eukprot:1670034-Amphidinium_carterae.1
MEGHFQGLFLRSPNWSNSQSLAAAADHYKLLYSHGNVISSLPRAILRTSLCSCLKSASTSRSMCVLVSATAVQKELFLHKIPARLAQIVANGLIHVSTGTQDILQCCMVIGQVAIFQTFALLY